MRKEYDLHLPWERNENNKIFNSFKRDFLFRLNPHWNIKELSFQNDLYRAEISEHDTGREKTLEGSCTKTRDGLIQISAREHHWQEITFLEQGGGLHASVCYSEEPAEEVERHVVLWLRSIKEYLRLYTRTTIHTRFFRLLMNRVILQMNPSQRKISLMLMRITVLEIVVILLIVVGWFFFFR